MLCSLTFSDDKKENLRKQGAAMARFGFSEMEAKYPYDTYAGVLRLDGWHEAMSEQRQEYKRGQS